MVTISHIVGKILDRKLFIEEALNKGIINYGALAELILPEVEHELKKKVKHSAVMMALRRHAEKAAKKLFRTARFNEDTDIIIRSDLVEITIVKTPDSGELIKKIYNIVDIKKGDFVSVVQGLNEISIITNRKHERSIEKLVRKNDVKWVEKELSSLTINIPEESTETIGLFYMITRALSWESIKIIEIVSTWSEMTYVLKTEEVSFAFNVIKKLVEENK